MSNLNRRDFFTAAASVTAAGAMLTGYQFAHAGAPAVRLRKDASTLDATSPDIVALKKAVGLMKAATLPNMMAMGANDGRRWEKQANIHGTKELFTNCQHGNWYFLPWHRIYLYHFEEIVRMLSGNEDFALPYWDWSRHRTLPAQFWGNGNPLNCLERIGDADSGRQPGRMPAMDATTRINDFDFDRVFSPTRISAMIDLTDFEQFGGGEVAMPSDEAFMGVLERGPHNRAHTWVGIRPPDGGPNRSGDMAHGDSPMDPIFWLHHCNVDRIWYRWSKRNPTGHPASAPWRATTFDHFYGRDGNAIAVGDRVTITKTLDTTLLGYTYDAVVTPLAASAGTQSRVMTRLVAANVAAESGSQAFQLAANDDFIKSVNTIAHDPLDEANRTSIRLIIKGIVPPKRLDTYYDVYLNCKKLTKDTPISDVSYVGSCTFFHHASERGHAMKDGVAFAFGLSRKFTQLYGDKTFGKDEPIEVSIIARVPGDGDKPATTVEVAKINPENVKIEVVGKAN